MTFLLTLFIFYPGSALAQESWVGPDNSSHIRGVVSDVREVDRRCEVVFSDVEYGWSAAGRAEDTTVVVNATHFSSGGGARPCPPSREKTWVNILPSFQVKEGDLIEAILTPVSDAEDAPLCFRLMEHVDAEQSRRPIGEPWLFVGSTQVLPPGSVSPVAPAPEEHVPVVLPPSQPIDIIWAERCLNAISQSKTGLISEEDALERMVAVWLREASPDRYLTPFSADWTEDLPCSTETAQGILFSYAEALDTLRAMEEAEYDITDLTDEPDAAEFPEEAPSTEGVPQ